MPSLYAIAEEFRAIDELLEATGGEWTDAIQARIDAVDLRLADKVDSYASYMRAREAFAKACEAEAEVLLAKAKAAYHTVDRMKTRALEVCEALGRTELAGTIWRLCRTANGGRPPLVLTQPDPAKLPARFVATRAFVDADALRAALERGEPEALAVAQLGPRGSHLRIR